MKIQNLHDSDLDYPLQLIKQFPHSRLFSKDLDNFVYSEPQTKVCILFGVRRTGKTTAMLQCISRMAEKERKKAVFFQISKPRKKNDQILSGDSLWDLLKEMREYLHSGYKYFFVDEATNLLDFNQGAEILSDIIALQGAKIILSGTDSLCLDDARSDALLGRSVTISTSFISFSEWSLLTNSNEIDTFARQGGILGDGQQIQAIFGIDSGCTEYIQSAYARNIEHSIAERKISNIPDEVIDLIEEGRFEGAVQRIVEDLNLRITLKALRKEFSLSAIGFLRNLIS